MTPFVKRVYQVVSRIPIGEVRTYRWVAAKAGRPRAYRAVGQILKRNPYPLLIPCHRVVMSKSDGQLQETPKDDCVGGYIFGIKKKKMLLQIERDIRRMIISPLRKGCSQAGRQKVTVQRKR